MIESRITPDPILRPAEAAARLGVNRVTLHRWAKKGDFPPSKRLGANSVGWRLSTIEAWLASRPDGGTRTPE